MINRLKNKKTKRGIEMVKLYYEDILVKEIMTNMSMTVDEALELIDFDEQKFIEENGFDDIDYNGFHLIGIDNIGIDNELNEKFILVGDYKEFISKHNTLEDAEKAMDDIPEEEYNIIHVLDETHWRMLQQM